MFCPQCGTETLEQLKFCKKCGANLRRVFGVMGKGGAGSLMHHEVMNEWQREALEEHRERRKRSSEEKRYDEIRAGVITSCVGLGVMIFLSFLFDAIANIAKPEIRDILRAIPLAGIIPFLIGLGIIINGVFVSKRIVGLKRQQDQPGQQPFLFPVANTSPVPQLEESAQQPISDYSIVESTTKTLREPIPVPSSRETN